MNLDPLRGSPQRGRGVGVPTPPWLPRRRELPNAPGETGRVPAVVTLDGEPDAAGGILARKTRGGWVKISARNLLPQKAWGFPCTPTLS